MVKRSKIEVKTINYKNAAQGTDGTRFHLRMRRQDGSNMEKPSVKENKVKVNQFCQNISLKCEGQIGLNFFDKRVCHTRV